MKRITFLSAIFILTFACYGQIKKHTSKDLTANNFEFDELSYIINKKTQDTILIEGKLKKTIFVNNIPCYEKITFNRQWIIKKFTLAEEWVFGEHIFPKDSYICLNLDVHKDIKSSTEYLAVRDDRNYKVLNSCTLIENYTINGLSCSYKYNIYFSKDWKLFVCVLADDDTVADNIIPKNTLVRFNQNGAIFLFSIEDLKIQGYSCSGTDYSGFWMGGGGIELYPNGKLKYFQPTEDIEIQGIWCKPSSVRGGVYLYETGNIKKCTSAKDQTLDGQFCGKNYTVTFDEEGKILRAYKDKIFD